MNFLESMKFRHACKVFDENKKISAGEFDFILEAGRLSPSSTGLEQWDFVVVQNEELRQKIREASWNQVQITSCSHLLVILAKVAEVKSVGEYVEKMIDRREDKAPDMIGDRKKFYGDFLEGRFHRDDELVYHWSSKQCYIAGGKYDDRCGKPGYRQLPYRGF